MNDGFFIYPWKKSFYFNSVKNFLQQSLTIKILYPHRVLQSMLSPLLGDKCWGKMWFLSLFHFAGFGHIHVAVMVTGHNFISCMCKEEKVRECILNVFLIYFCSQNILYEVFCWCPKFKNQYMWAERAK